MADTNTQEYVKVQLAVDFTSTESANEVVQRLKQRKSDFLSVEFDLKNQTITVNSNLPSQKIVDLIESNGDHKAVITGIGSLQTKNGSSSTSTNSRSTLGSAVALMHEGNPLSGIRGVTRVVQSSMDECLIDGTLDGLEPNTQYCLGVHEFGDLSSGCQSCGDVLQTAPGVDICSERPYGDLGFVHSDDTGRASFRKVDNKVKTWDIIGRSMVLSKLTETNNRRKLSCGVIARSAGLFENTKKICACDGITIWDERDVPVAGSSRRANSQL